MKARRIVTGHDDNGKAVFSSDEVVEPVTLKLLPGFETFELWTTNGTTFFPDGTGYPGAPNYFPAPGGSVFRYVTFPPGEEGIEDPDFDFAAALDEASTKLPALVAKLEPDNPGMHTTDSVDYGIVLSGELDLELDDGATVHMTAGDCVIQRGTRHAWRNRSGEPAVMAFVLLGSEPR